MKLLAIANINNILIKGYISFKSLKNISFIEEEQIQSIKDIPENPNDFKSLSEFSKIFGYPLTIKDIKDTLKSLNMKSLYIYDEPPVLKDNGVLTPVQWERYWFRYNNSICNTCKHSCKESSRVDMIICSKYKKKEK